MESNRDEAEKCLEIAKKHLRSGDRDKAKKFLEKSIRLYPLKEAAGLLEAVMKNGFSTASSTEENHTRKRTRSEGKSTPMEDDYTKEQVEAVERIKSCKDFYEIFNVSKNPSEAELKKCYRKLALQFHPDKNKAPGATEAFKRIGTAFAVLSDPEKKARYDEYGETLEPARIGRRQYNDFEREFEDISPEDIFNMFFGGGYPTGRVYVHRRNRATRHQHHHHHHASFQGDEQNVPAYYPIMQLLPIFILVAFSLLSSLLVQDPPYSFHQNGNYIHPRVTNRYSVQYFVQKSFSKSYGGESLKQLEGKIERDYIEKIQISCYKERQYKQEMLFQARVWGNKELLRKADSMDMRSCKQLEDLMAQ